MRPVLSVVTAATLTLLAAPPCLAEGLQTSISGFGTIGVVSSDNPSGAFVVPVQASGSYDGHVEAGVDSKLGVQGTVVFNDTFSATAQLVTRQMDNQWGPSVEWLFAKAQLPKGFSVRLGRIGGPFYAVSDYRLIDYANLWVRPPVDVYGQVFFYHLDGGDVLWQTQVGSTTVRVQAFIGDTKMESNAGTLEARQVKGLNVSLEFGPWSMRVGHATTTLYSHGATNLDLLLGGLRQASAMPGLGALSTLADELSVDGKPATFSGVGLTYDQGSVIVTSEWTRRRSDSYAPDVTGHYVTGGYRFGAWTPYLTLSRLRQDSPTSSTVVPAVGPLVPLAAGVNLLLASNGQRTQSVGVRWDARTNLAIKAQYDRIRVDDGGTGLFRAAAPGANSSPVNVFSLAASFVF